MIMYAAVSQGLILKFGTKQTICGSRNFHQGGPGPTDKGLTQPK